MDEVDETHRYLMELAQQYLPPEGLALIQRAYERASAAHAGIRRKSGEPYVMHPLAVAIMLAEMRMGAATLAAALLHDAAEDNQAVTIAALEQEFGAEIARMVEGLTRLSMDKVRPLLKIEQPTYDQVEQVYLFKLFMTIAQDLRVIVIKLCDRLHNMQTVHALPPDRQLRMARETLELFAPLAGRLGIWTLKKQLEDLALYVTDFEACSEIEQIRQACQQLSVADLEQTIQQLGAALARDGIQATIEPLPEHIYGIYRLVQDSGWENVRSFDGLRVGVIVDSVRDCYAALNIVHSLWQPVPGQFCDFIASPKEGLYRSLHTLVIGVNGHPLEVRIRTHQMKRLADYGVIAYLEHGANSTTLPPLPSVLQIEELGELEDDPQVFLQLLKAHVAAQQICIFTPKGDIVSLPVGATPVDFAYAVHTEIGHSCLRALVNWKPVPLNTRLNDGDRVEIIRSGVAQPDRLWLDTDLGYVTTPYALKQIRRWLARQPEEELIRQGRQLIESEIECWRAQSDWKSDGVNLLARRRGMTATLFCLRVGRGEISPAELAAFVLKEALGWTDEQTGLIVLEINAADRRGLLLDVCQIMMDDKVSMQEVLARSSGASELAYIRLTFTPHNIPQLVRITHRLAHIRGVMRVRCLKE